VDPGRPANGRSERFAHPEVPLGHQRTIQRAVTCEGIGIHTGAEVRMTLRPAPANTGIVFCRADLAGQPVVPATPEWIDDVHYATTIARRGVRVRTVEHLMAAFAGVGLDNVRVELDGPEVPVMDGSALPFVALLRRAGLRRQLAPKVYLKVNTPLEVALDGRSLKVVPADHLEIVYTMHFELPCLGDQTVRLDVNPESFPREIAPARTYAFLRDVEHLRGMGLAKGGSLDNALIVGEQGLINGPLRFPDELVRHKALDLVGDLFLLGQRLVGTVTAEGAGHMMHARLVQMIHDHLKPRPRAARAPRRRSVVEQILDPLRPVPAEALEEPTEAYGLP
jgi:UDP-3-O-[3-hydroxymyristoyl] N-acetylglucosamine deacetylase